MKAYTLFSGSKGNCIYIKTDKTQILVDCGVCERNIRNAVEKVGGKMDETDAIFITHEHSDHVAGIRVIEKRYNTPVHITKNSAYCLVKNMDNPYNLFLHDEKYTVLVNELEVSSFSLSHDSESAVGYTIHDTVTGQKIGIATDTGCVTKEMKAFMAGCESVVLESNHDTDMLKCGPYPEDLKRRIHSKYGHLSNKDAAEFAAYLAENGTKRIVLFHLSDENNTPKIAVQTVKNAIDNDEIAVVAAEKCDAVEII